MEWEYYTLKMKVAGFWGAKIDTQLIDGTLNELGREGWELVSLIPVTQAYGIVKELVMVFKRQR